MATNDIDGTNFLALICTLIYARTTVGWRITFVYHPFFPILI